MGFWSMIFSLFWFAFGCLTTVLSHGIYITLILFGLALFTVPKQKSFAAWLKSYFENPREAIWVYIFRRYVVTQGTVETMTDTRYLHLGFCQLVTCQFPSQERESLFLGIFNTWVHLK